MYNYICYIAPLRPDGMFTSGYLPYFNGGLRRKRSFQSQTSLNKKANSFVPTGFVAGGLLGNILHTLKGVNINNRILLKRYASSVANELQDNNRQ